MIQNGDYDKGQRLNLIKQGYALFLTTFNGYCDEWLHSNSCHRRCDTVVKGGRPEAADVLPWQKHDLIEPTVSTIEILITSM